MLDLRQVVDNLATIRASLIRRNPGLAELLAPLEELSQKRKAAITASETRAARRNAANNEMAKLTKGSPEFLAKRDELKQLSDEQKVFEKEKEQIEYEIARILEGVPNVPHASVPDGADADANKEIKRWGTVPAFSFTPKAHHDLGPALGILDFDRGAKLSGSRFTVLMGAGARLERALIQFMLDIHTKEHGYTEVSPPFMVKGTALFGTGNFPKFVEDVFHLENRAADLESPDRRTKDPKWFAEDLFLIPTAEVPVTNIHAGEILEADKLPVAYASYTPCFRSEAGSAGRDVKGMIRQHQFDKVEIVRLATPETAEEQHELLTSHAEKILERLGLHYRRMLLCTGDMGFSSHKTYDLEVWIPSENTFREISSCSWFNDFQARRADLRFRNTPKDKPKLLHTLNGSGLAVGRTLVAIMENYQQSDGSIVIPEALRPYFGGDKITK